MTRIFEVPENIETLGGASKIGESLENKHEAKGMRIKLQVCYGDSKVNGIFLI